MDDLRVVDISDVEPNPTLTVPTYPEPLCPTSVYRVYIVNCTDENCPSFGFWGEEYDSLKQANKLVKKHLKECHPEWSKK